MLIPICHLNCMCVPWLRPFTPSFIARVHQTWLADAASSTLDSIYFAARAYLSSIYDPGRIPQGCALRQSKRCAAGPFPHLLFFERYDSSKSVA